MSFPFIINAEELWRGCCSKCVFRVVARNARYYFSWHCVLSFRSFVCLMVFFSVGMADEVMWGSLWIEFVLRVTRFSGVCDSLMMGSLIALCSRMLDFLFWTCKFFNFSTFQFYNFSIFKFFTFSIYQFFNWSIVQLSNFPFFNFPISVFQFFQFQFFICSFVQLFNCSIVQLFNFSIFWFFNFFIFHFYNFSMPLPNSQFPNFPNIKETLPRKNTSTSNLSEFQQNIRKKSYAFMTHKNKLCYFQIINYPQHRLTSRRRN